MNLSKVKTGIGTIFLAFLVPVLNHGFWAISSTIQNSGRMIGDESNSIIIWAKQDLLNFIYQMPWIMWIYFVPMLIMGLYLITKGLKEKENTEPTD